MQKKQKNISCLIDTEVWAEIKAYAARHDITMVDAVTRIFTDFVDKIAPEAIDFIKKENKNEPEK